MLKKLLASRTHQILTNIIYPKITITKQSSNLYAMNARNKAKSSDRNEKNGIQIIQTK